MKFLYETDFQQLKVDCPPTNYKPLNIKAYRWVYGAGDERNFQSQYEKDSKRKNPPKRYNDMSDLEKCERMALSFFVSLEFAEKNFFFWRDVQKMRENAYKFLGTGIAMGEISVSDGVNEIPADKRGHFNHHPAASVHYSNTFKIIVSFCKQ
jgi:hypothetical protein